MIVEIDARRINGHGGEVLWHLHDGRHIVTVTDADGTIRASLLVVDGRIARDVFEHPFAQTTVPNLFDRRADAA
jgi:hypothetical protein